MIRKMMSSQADRAERAITHRMVRDTGEIHRLIADASHANTATGRARVHAVYFV